MTTVYAPESVRDLLALVDDPNAGPIAVQSEERTAVLLSMTAYQQIAGTFFEDIHRANVKEFRRFSEELSAKVTSQGLTEAKLAEILAEIDAETPR